jgi:choline dehydrogenase-like flavoprotein
MTDQPVDVLIIGAGAAGAAFAWSLADTRMNILCLEQGGWMNPAEYPGMRTDWEASQFGAFALSPNARGRREGLPRQRFELADPGVELQRRRRQHDPLRGALPALPSVRLPRTHARRRRGRLADRLRDTRALV